MTGIEIIGFILSIIMVVISAFSCGFCVNHYLELKRGLNND